MFRLTFFLLLIPLIQCSCPIGSIEWQTKCYFFQNNPAGFSNAEVYCASFGGHLASIHDGFTNSLLTENANTNFQQSNITDFWVGLSNLETGGSLSWTDGTPIDYNNWDYNQPIYTTNNCGSVNLNNGKWKINECDFQKPFVCATVKFVPTTTLPPQNCSGSLAYFEPTNSCYGIFFSRYIDRQDWSSAESYCQSIHGHLASVHSHAEYQFIITYFEPTNSCYGIFFSRYIDRQDWSSAESYCQSIHGHLASVHSHAEYQFIITLWNFANAYNEPWLGLFSNNNGYTWEWSDGSSVDYFPWEQGYPHTADSYYCAYASKNGLENYYCSYHYSAVCKIQLSHKIAKVVAITYDCNTNSTVYLEFDEVAFFETPDFPKILEHPENCNLSFSLSSQDSDKKIRLLVAFFDPLSGLSTEKPSYFLTLNVPFYPIKSEFRPGFEAQIGAVLFEKEPNNCLFETRNSKKEMVLLNDETQIFHIQLNNDKNVNQKYPCEWKLSAPEGYGFKIVIEIFEVSSNLKLTVKNSTDIILNERSVNILHPYYNEDNWLQINLSKINSIFMNPVEFQAYITVVKKAFKVAADSCFLISKANNKTIWTNQNNETYRYSKNSRCTLNLVISPKTVVLTKSVKNSLEPGVDHVGYYNENNDFVIIDPGLLLVFEPHKNGTEKHVFWEFVSDGSLEFSGFKVYFATFFPSIDRVITLSKEEPNAIIDLGFTGFVVVNVDETIVGFE
uniref:C-type lectin domain-containing protein n=1 Tax=Panagrolaimus sp. ES5 TaxID=591445 RepID=A0AC34FE70_9BILA